MIIDFSYSLVYEKCCVIVSSSLSRGVITSISESPNASEVNSGVKAISDFIIR